MKLIRNVLSIALFSVAMFNGLYSEEAKVSLGKLEGFYKHIATVNTYKRHVESGGEPVQALQFDLTQVRKDILLAVTHMESELAINRSLSTLNRLNGVYLKQANALEQADAVTWEEELNRAIAALETFESKFPRFFKKKEQLTAGDVEDLAYPYAILFMLKQNEETEFEANAIQELDIDLRTLLWGTNEHKGQDWIKFTEELLTLAATTCVESKEFGNQTWTGKSPLEELSVLPYIGHSPAVLLNAIVSMHPIPQNEEQLRELFANNVYFRVLCTDKVKLKKRASDEYFNVITRSPILSNEMAKHFFANYGDCFTKEYDEIVANLILETILRYHAIETNLPLEWIVEVAASHEKWNQYLVKVRDFGNLAQDFDFGQVFMTAVAACQREYGEILATGTAEEKKHLLDVALMRLTGLSLVFDTVFPEELQVENTE